MVSDLATGSSRFYRRQLSAVHDLGRGTASRRRDETSGSALKLRSGLICLPTSCGRWVGRLWPLEFFGSVWGTVVFHGGLQMVVTIIFCRRLVMPISSIRIRAKARKAVRAWSFHPSGRCGLRLRFRD